MPTWVCLYTCLAYPGCVWAPAVYVAPLCTAAASRLLVVSNKAVTLTFPQQVVVLSAPPSDTHVQRWRHQWHQCMKCSSFEWLTGNSSCILCKVLSEWDRTESIPGRSRLKSPSVKGIFLDLLLMLLSILDWEKHKQKILQSHTGFTWNLSDTAPFNNYSIIILYCNNKYYNGDGNVNGTDSPV